MHPFVSPALELKRRTASDVIPGWIVGLLAALQVVLWLVIMILEGVSVYYSATQGTIYAGFWCSGVFFITWVSMFCFLCCGKANCCGVHLIVINTIAFCFSITLVAFTSVFINDPCKCYVIFCDDVSWFSCIDRFILRKVPYLKGLLACSVLMLLTNLGYIVTYIAVSIWLCKRGNADMQKMNAMFQNRSGNVDFAHQQQYPPYPMNYPPQVGEQQYPPYPMNYPAKIGEQPYSMHPTNEAYRQPPPKKPTSQEKPSQNDAADEGRL